MFPSRLSPVICPPALGEELLMMVSWGNELTTVD